MNENKKGKIQLVNNMTNNYTSIMELKTLIKDAVDYGHSDVYLDIEDAKKIVEYVEDLKQTSKKPLTSTKHVWRKDENGGVDEMAWDRDFHNGPVCVVCGEHPCVHCQPNYKELEDCFEHYICPVCGEYLEDGQKYCKECGTKIDWRNSNE